jgi:hypothetical protein
MGMVPAYYSQKHIRHWSQSKARCPLSYLICEYMVRQPRYYEAQTAKADADPEADFRLKHYAKPTNIQMAAGTAVHTAAFAVANGSDFVEQLEAVMDALRAHTPVPWLERDAALQDFMLSDIDAVEQTLNNAVEGIREAFVGANTIDAEDRFEIDLPGIEIPTIGYCDGRGGGTTGELKTKWDRVNAKSASGFAANSLPREPDKNDIQQAALYRHVFGGTAKLIYANRLGHRVFILDDEQCTWAVQDLITSLRKRQALFERHETVEDLINVVEVDFGDFRFGDYSAELLAEFRKVMNGRWEA